MSEREVVARIIDPWAWSIALAPDETATGRFDQQNAQIRRTATLQKADAVIEAIDAYRGKL